MTGACFWSFIFIVAVLAPLPECSSRVDLGTSQDKRITGLNSTSPSLSPVSNSRKMWESPTTKTGGRYPIVIHLPSQDMKWGEFKVVLSAWESGSGILLV